MREPTVWIVIRKDLLRRLRSPLASIVYLLFPFVFSGLMALAFGSGGGGGIPRVQVAIVDQDAGIISRFVLSVFSQEQVSRFFETTQTSAEEAMELVEKNKVAGAIIIPKGFSEAVLDRRETHLKVIKNPAQSIGPMAIEEMAEMIAQILDGGAKVLAEPLERIMGLARGTDSTAPRMIQGGFPTDEAVAEIAALVNRTLRSIRHFAFPPVICLERTQILAASQDAADQAESAAKSAAAGSSGDGGEPDEEEGTSRLVLIFSYVLPGMATFALFMLALGFMADIPRERNIGTLARQLTSPVHASGIIAGKILSTVIMGLLVAAAMAVIGALLLKVRADLGAFALLCLAFLGAATGFLTLVFGFARSEQQGSTLASIVIMVMAMVGGSWIPLNSLPSFCRMLAPATLNYWAITGFQEIMISGAGIVEIAQPLAILFTVGIVGTLVGSWIVQRRLMQGA
ncbi:MAG: ABC-2 transporter permease [Candidatus Eisenbacteria sp.]|nr:ABC-2 transporter permease [Candidatus Eisenbacteria bacterium]